jgi:hypothetical protein
VSGFALRVAVRAADLHANVALSLARQTPEVSAVEVVCGSAMLIYTDHSAYDI